MKIYKRRFFCEPLRANADNKNLLKEFVIRREEGYAELGGIVGLEAYLKECAWNDDEEGLIKAYVIKPYFSREIVAYFTLQAGMVSVDAENRNSKRELIARMEGTKLVPATIPGIEISHFAVNDLYREKHSVNGIVPRGLGRYLYPEFIYPTIRRIRRDLGVKMVYLYAAGDEHLKTYYQDVFGFSRLEEETLFVPVTSYYDDYCEFMYKLL